MELNTNEYIDKLAGTVTAVQTKLAAAAFDREGTKAFVSGARASVGCSNGPSMWRRPRDP